jgi:osmotically-inducible protein OsmY
MKSKTPMILALCMTAAALSGCAAAVIGGAATGVAVAHDRRTGGTVVEDRAIHLKAASRLRSDSELWGQSHINVTSYNMSVLLTGETPTEALRARAEQLVREVEKVDRVYNEITIAAPSSVMSRSSDSVITGRVKTSFLGIRDIEGFDLTRVKVVTERGIVYLLGMVTRAEADAVTERARQVGGVQRVVRLFEYI